MLAKVLYFILLEVSSNNKENTQNSSERSRRRKKVFRFILSVLTSLILLWLVYRKIDLNPLFEQLRKGDIGWGILLLSVLFEVIANTLRGLRWYIQLQPLSEQNISKPILIAGLWGTYTLNLVLPRMGDIWRCYLVSNTQKISFTSTLGSLVTERIVDLLMMLLLLLLVFVCYTTQTMQLLNHIRLANLLQQVLHSPWLYVALVLMVALVTLFRRTVTKWSVWTRLVTLGRSFVKGLISVRHMKGKWLFILLTFVIYFFYILAFYITFFAFPFMHNMGVGVGLLAFIMATFGVAVPVQGGIGPWHFMCITTLVAFGISHNNAGAFALVVHTFQTVGIAVVGLIAILFVPLLTRTSAYLTNKKQDINAYGKRNFEP